MAADRSFFKLYMADTGLLVTQMLMSEAETEDSLYKSLVLDKLGINQGLIMENLIAQVLTSSGRKLYFHEFEYLPQPSQAGTAEIKPVPKRYEIDYLIVRSKQVCPVEVKPSGYRAHKSLDCFLEKYRDWKIAEKFVFHTRDLEWNNEILYLPLYMAICL